jgi:hypothetical protein
MSANARSGARISLHYFEDVLAVEFASIARRRERRPEGLLKSPVASNSPPGVQAARESAPAAEREMGMGVDRRRRTDPVALERKVKGILGAWAAGDPYVIAKAEPNSPEEAKQRPMPVPCDATGLSLSGGGVRSAALGLGVLQALNAIGVLESFDYLSTVSGGGYIGGTLTAGLSQLDPNAEFRSPFAHGVADGPTVARLRDYSNYLFPRGRSSLRNWTDVAAILLRGLVANAVPVLAVLFFLALGTRLAFPTTDALEQGNYLASLLGGVVNPARHLLGLDGDRLWPSRGFGSGHFGFTLLLWWLLALVLILWAIVRSFRARARAWDDADSLALSITGVLTAVVAASAFLDLQPLAIHALAAVLKDADQGGGRVESLFAWLLTPLFVKKGFGGFSLVAFATAISASGNLLGAFLTASRSAKDWTTIGKRVAARLAIVVAAMVLPLVLWVAYLYLSETLISGRSPQPGSDTAGWMDERFFPSVATAGVALIILGACAAVLNGNAYSLHRFYRDRLSRAFLFFFAPGELPGPRYLDGLKLSDLIAGPGPYPILNSALNVQGSANANKRGRNADFFMFTPYFVGSDLTLYAPAGGASAGGARGVEEEEPALDFGTAIAISGAAVSANMGSSTVRLLSPTLALLNFRLGYWLRNPRDLAKASGMEGALGEAWRSFKGKFYLLAEMLNLLDETSAHIYLTDGGHIENLGVYELLKRGCKLIVAVDGEADPSMSFPSLQIVERYARIDFGVRIDLPWEAIASRSREVDAACAEGAIVESSGPHCAVGRIHYADDAEGVLLYFKASLTGDEKDYILDYKKRNPRFPHETTGDQFFTEEQFEAYRALGFHMVEHFFDQDDDFGFLAEGEGAFGGRREAREALDLALPALRRLR